MCHSLRLYEDIDHMITKMVVAKAKQMVESLEEIESRTVNHVKNSSTDSRGRN